MNEWMRELEPPSDPRLAARPRRTHSVDSTTSRHNIEKSKNTVQNLQQACERLPQQKSQSAIHSTSPNANGRKITLEDSSHRAFAQRLLDLSRLNGILCHCQASSCGLPSSVCRCIQLLAFNRNEVTFQKPAGTLPRSDPARRLYRTIVAWICFCQCLASMPSFRKTSIAEKK
ncbi:hypothetical protein DL98DRAFT_7897 [Cadophora sp. DSE1049]|nr:hypothetical protein DL98DRAFT_7897 [Cadophora sp. DSE1049]